MVPGAGIEPARLAAGDFESPASTNFTTRARERRPRLCHRFFGVLACCEKTWVMVVDGLEVRMVWAAIGTVANPCNRHQWQELLLAGFQNERKFRWVRAL